MAVLDINSLTFGEDTYNLKDPTKINTSSKGVAGGVAELDASGKVPVSQCPIEEDVAQATTGWLNEHIAQETGYVIDDSLTVSGAAADAKKVGDEVSDLKSVLKTDTVIHFEWEQGRISNAGANVASNYAIRSKPIAVDASKNKITIIFGEYPYPSGAYGVALTICEYGETVIKTDYFSYESWRGSHTFASQTTSFRIVMYYTPTNTITITPSMGYIVTACWSDDALAQYLFDLPNSEDYLVNDLYSYVNYGYDTPFFSREVSSGTWKTKCGILRNNQVIVLNKSTITSSICIKISGDVLVSATADQIDAWSNSFNIQVGHSYCVTVKLLRGISYYDDPTDNIIPVASVIRVGEHNSVGSSTEAKGCTKRYFIAEENESYNIAFNLAKGHWIFNNAMFLVTLQDMTELKKYDDQSLPYYYFENDYLPEQIAKINANRLAMSNHAVEFIWITDLHIFSQNGSVANAMNSVKLCNYIAKKANINTIYCGGDLLRNNYNDGMTQEDCMGFLGEIRNYFNSVWDHTYMIIGNHEWNNPANLEPSREITSIAPLKMILMQESYKRGAKLIFGGKESSYGSYVVDDDNLNTRTLFIGCTEAGTIAKEEYEWIAEVLKATTNGQQVLVMSHIGLLANGTLDDGASNISRLKYVVDMLEAALSKDNDFSFYIEKYQDGSKVNLQRVPSGTNVFDFSGCNFSLIGCIAGHNHKDKNMTTTGGTLVVTTTCDQLVDSHTTREADTITEQAFDVVQIDLDNKKIYMTRIGGSWDGTGALQNPDREFTY